ncbi:MAG: hypothetical protein QOG84_930 [Sphingomonadales bacterium]|nr:hypothetical protein [Sphingomonadales bacterium]
MFDEFQRKTIDLSQISLDPQNPRIVTLEPLSSEAEIISYFFEHEGLADFIKKIAAEGLNPGAETPFVVKDGKGFVVVEGNSRIAAYKLLTGIATPSKEHKALVPAVSDSLKKSLSTIECAVAPDRENLLPIMASAHFGLGDKSKWGYLGSRKAVHDEWVKGHTVPQLAKIFAQPKGRIRDFILEYKLFLQALQFEWPDEEREKLEDPAVKFNPPVRFLQGQNHKERVGVELDRDSLQIKFTAPDATDKLQHLIRKLVTKPVKGLGATAKYDEVFADYKAKPGSAATVKGKGASPNLKQGALFNYPVTLHNQLLKQLAKEARNLNCIAYPACGTFLLRNFLEVILKHIIDAAGANPQKKSLSLEGALNLCTSNAVSLHADDKKILGEFRKSHLDNINLGAHGTLIPNHLRLFAARDCIDQFVKRNV